MIGSKLNLFPGRIRREKKNKGKRWKRNKEIEYLNHITDAWLAWGSISKIHRCCCGVSGTRVASNLPKFEKRYFSANFVKLVSKYLRSLKICMIKVCPTLKDFLKTPSYLDRGYFWFLITYWIWCGSALIA